MLEATATPVIAAKVSISPFCQPACGTDGMAGMGGATIGGCSSVTGATGTLRLLSCRGGAAGRLVASGLAERAAGARDDLATPCLAGTGPAGRRGRGRGRRRGLSRPFRYPP